MYLIHSEIPVSVPTLSSVFFLFVAQYCSSGDYFGTGLLVDYF